MNPRPGRKPNQIHWFAVFVDQALRWQSVAQTEEHRRHAVTCWSGALGEGLVLC